MFASPQKVKKGVKIYAIMEFTVLKSPKAYATHICLRPCMLGWLWYRLN